MGLWSLVFQCIPNGNLLDEVVSVYPDWDDLQCQLAELGTSTIDGSLAIIIHVYDSSRDKNLYLNIKETGVYPKATDVPHPIDRLCGVQFNKTELGELQRYCRGIRGVKDLFRKICFFKQDEELNEILNRYERTRNNTIQL